MKQLHIKFSDEEWKQLNDIYETRKNELEDSLLHKITLTETIKNSILTSYMIHVDKNFCLMPTPKQEEEPKENTNTAIKPKKEKFISEYGARIILEPRPKAKLKPAK